MPDFTEFSTRLDAIEKIAFSLFPEIENLARQFSRCLVLSPEEDEIVSERIETIANVIEDCHGEIEDSLCTRDATGICANDMA